jgi:hypothetical protein
LISPAMRVQVYLLALHEPRMGQGAVARAAPYIWVCLHQNVEMQVCC